MLHAAVYDPIGNIAKALMKEILGFEKGYIDCADGLSCFEIEDLILKHDIDVVFVSYDEQSFWSTDFVKKIISQYPNVYVVAISPNGRYEQVRSAFLLGVFDFLTLELLGSELKKTLLRIPDSRYNVYFTEKIYDKVMLLARHIFDGGANVAELVHDIVKTVWDDRKHDPIACQLVIERIKQESYSYFVSKKPWLEKFIYRGDYIRDIGFELRQRDEVEEELCRYYSEVNELFYKYNVIDVNKTIYTIGKSIIRQVDGKTTLESVANDVYLNKSYVSYIFKKMTGISFNDFLLDVKVDRAKTLLHYPDMSISEISSILGFCSSGYFSSQFRRHTGISPTKYREGIKK